ncbi:MAG: PD-(D/E)XK nuclease family protein [Planctomycetota bacterium]|jgi:ATP-dependent helicase/nuclease subunit B
MAVQFILGRSGTGKTSFCIKAVVDALLESSEQPLILLVPEQATYQAERAVLSDKRVAGYSRLKVLSFDRLGFLLLGKNTARPGLSHIGRQMIIHRILRDNISELKAFGSSAERSGLSVQMAEIVSELHRYAKTPEDIEHLLGQLQKTDDNNLSALKFADIGIVFKEYLKSIEGKFIDPDIQLNRARRKVAEAGFVRGARLWVDGFSSITVSEREILTELLKTVADAQIALCLDPSKVDVKNIEPVSLFYPTERTYAELVGIIKKCGLRTSEPIVFNTAVRFSGCRQLGHIEGNMFNSEAAKMSTDGKVRIVSASNARGEAKFVAREIVKLVREKDYRYRDIAVIASDIEKYQHYIRAYFEDYSIPFFIDKPKPLNQHPVVGLICSALQVVTGGFLHSDIFVYLKTGLVPIESYDVDLLENYCLAFGIGGSDWASDEDWHFVAENEQFDEQRIKQIRHKVRAPLLELRDKLRPVDNPVKTISAERFTQVIFDFLEDLNVRETIGKRIEYAQERGDSATVEEHQQLYNRLIDTFDELVETFGGRQMSCEDYFAVINSAFSQLTLAFIPPKLDQVLVGSIDRSRHPDLKAVFLIGATQKQFPSPISYDSLLTDDDRQAAESADFSLAETAEQSLAQRQYLAYIAFTRPSQLLCVTYPATDEKGSAVVCSQFIDNLESLFEDLREKTASIKQIDIEKVGCESELADLLCSDRRFDKLSNDMRSDEMLGDLGSAVRYAKEYDNRARLDKKIVGELFGRKIAGSATKLGTFAACPYKHFAGYILELKEREEFKFEPLDLGIFYHRVLDALLKQLGAAKKDFTTIGDEELLGLLRKQISEFVQSDAFISNFARHSAHNRFIIHTAGEVLEDCVLAIAQMVRAGSFSPRLSEVSFNDYKIAFSKNRQLILKGKIDRLDIANVNGENIAVVFDYKRKAKSFNWSQFYHGLDIQLGIYMLAVRDASDLRCEIQKIAGAFYMPVETETKLAGIDEAPGKKDSFNYKARGIFSGQFFRQLDGEAALRDSKYYNFYITKDGQPYGQYGNRGALKPDDFEKVLQFTREKIVQMAEEIISGKIDVNPYKLGGKSPCSYCKYKPLCRFDWQINDYNSLVSLGKTEVLERTGTIDG